MKLEIILKKPGRNSNSQIDFEKDPNWTRSEEAPILKPELVSKFHVKNFETSQNSFRSSIDYSNVIAKISTSVEFMT